MTKSLTSPASLVAMVYPSRQPITGPVLTLLVNTSSGTVSLSICTFFDGFCCKGLLEVQDGGNVLFSNILALLVVRFNDTEFEESIKSIPHIRPNRTAVCIAVYQVVEEEYSADRDGQRHLFFWVPEPAWGGRSVPVGTLRLQALPNSTVVKLGRIAVMKPHRQQGIARRMITVAENIARSMGMTRCFMHAQADKIAVYERLGYRVGEGSEGNEVVTINDVEGAGTDRRGQFLEDGVWHVKMYKNIFQAN